MKRFKDRRRRLLEALGAGQTDLAHLRASLASWARNAEHTDTRRSRETLARTFAWLSTLAGNRHQQAE